ncbi:hypothetical protein K474DRAFT_45032 [Panus rudis PR-1116 ss-1]|nr:hypothetical protein K474DRAFT_45032 [Panus rudis PR-1116 ss-1]
MTSSAKGPVDILILGAGWTSTFLIPLCTSNNISYAATSRPSENDPSKPKTPDTILFEFDPNSDDPKPFEVLPKAKTVLITFPIRVKGASERLVRLYQETHAGDVNGEVLQTAFIQLGSTGIWDKGPTFKGGPAKWFDRHTPYDSSNDRAIAEKELLELSSHTPTTVLNLCGLWGGERHPKHWVGRVAPSKEALRVKGGVHMIHGEDVSRAILAVHSKFALANGQRWLLTNQRIYDWWELVSTWGDQESKQKVPDSERQEGDGEKGPHPRWVRELMVEEGVRVLPRNVEQMGSAKDSRDFWTTFDLDPVRTRFE